MRNVKPQADRAVGLRRYVWIAMLAPILNLAHTDAMVARPSMWLLALAAIVLGILMLGQHDDRLTLGQQVQVGPCLAASADGCGAVERQSPSGCRIACTGMALAMAGEWPHPFWGHVQARRPASPVLAHGRTIAPDPRPPQVPATA